MSDELKPKYETPVAVSLGERHVGSGKCTPGSGDASICELSGNSAGGVCISDGNSAGGECAAGSDFAPPP
jgi:hypothetical protein